MATKKDLLEAQKFSRSRLLSAFIGGAPGGKELEPAKPLRAVFGGIALTAMVLLAGLFIGFLQPGLPGGWENNRLIVARDTGARYVSVDSMLYPVINTASARLLIPADEFSVVSVNQSTLSDIPIGATIGIVGAPDTLPASEHLDGTAWRACAAPDRTDLWVGGASRTAAPAGSGTVVERDGATFVVAGSYSYAVPAAERASVLRAIGLSTVTPPEVRGEWLALFETGADLTPLTIAGAGDAVAGTTLPAGTVIHQTGSAAAELFILTADGALAPLSPLAYQMYLLGDGAGELGQVQELGPAELARLANAEPAGSADWPTEVLEPTQITGSPCATLSGDLEDQRTILAIGGPGEAPSSDSNTEAPSAGAPAPGGSTQSSAGAVFTHLPAGGGALVRGGRAGTLTLIDATGKAFSLPGSFDRGGARLGYTLSDEAVVPAAWLQLLPFGPELSPEAASSTLEAAGVSASS